MKECVECGKKLGIIQSYRHPTKGKNYLLCSSCFDIVTESVKKWSEFISPYIGFFKNESSSTCKIFHGENNYKDKSYSREIFNNIIFSKNPQNFIRK